MIKSLEQKPVRKGIPVNARFPIISVKEVNGVAWNKPSIFWIACLSFRLWTIDPEHVNSIALKKCMYTDREKHHLWLVNAKSDY